MKDIILEKFFELERWEYAIEKGVGKDVNKGALYQLCKPEVRAKMCEAIVTGKYKISPPHTAQIPKDTPGEFRTVYVNEPIDRIFLSIANDLLIELTPQMTHKSCVSYQKGIGCGKIVKELSGEICRMTEGKGDDEVIGWKSDLSKYFDSVPINFIDDIFDIVESEYGKSAIIDVIRDYYHSDWYFDENNVLHEKYQSLKQGCSVASWLANALLYHVDRALSNMNGYYRRYSDDMVFIGPDYKKAMKLLEELLEDMNMKLNPKKVEYLTNGKWFKFLGYSIKGDKISISSTRIKRFQKEIEHRTIKNKGVTYQRALNSVNNYLYKGNGEFSWATQILGVVNVKHDIDVLNAFVMDALRAVITGKGKIGGLGYIVSQKDGCVMRGTGKNVKANRQKTGVRLEGYITLGCMQNAMRTRKSAYKTLVASL